jgi:hypothetical protein
VNGPDEVPWSRGSITGSGGLGRIKDLLDQTGGAPRLAGLLSTEPIQCCLDRLWVRRGVRTERSLELE